MAPCLDSGAVPPCSHREISDSAGERGAARGRYHARQATSSLSVAIPYMLWRGNSLPAISRHDGAPWRKHRPIRHANGCISPTDKGEAIVKSNACSHCICCCPSYRILCIIDIDFRKARATEAEASPLCAMSIVAIGRSVINRREGISACRCESRQSFCSIRRRRHPERQGMRLAYGRRRQPEAAAARHGGGAAVIISSSIFWLCIMPISLSTTSLPATLCALVP